MPAIHETIHVAEDDPLTRMVLVNLLNDAGFSVVEAIDGVDALQKLTTLPRIDGLVTDLDMPKVGELEVAYAVRSRWRKIPVFVVSGAIGADKTVSAIPGSRYIPKPFAPDLLAFQVSRAIPRR